MVNSPLNIIFAGTPGIAATVLEQLIASRHTVMAVYTQPDRPAGRGRKLQASPVKQLALQHHIEVQQPTSLKNEEAQQTLASYQADLLIVVAYGLILPQAVLDTPKHGCINVHVSLLPRWRGAAPIQHAILAGDKETGVTIMQMDAGLDTGPILLQRSCPIDATDTSGMLHDKLAVLGASSLLETLDLLCQGKLVPQTQDDSLASYADKISKQNACIDWSQPAENIMHAIRAYCPWPVAHTYFTKKVLKIWDAEIINEDNTAPVGSIVSIDKSFIDVQTGKHVLRLLTVQLPGSKAMPVQAMLNGNADLFHVGDQFENQP